MGTSTTGTCTSPRRTATRSTATTVTLDPPVESTLRVVVLTTHGVLSSTSSPTTHMSPVSTRITFSATSNPPGACTEAMACPPPTEASTSRILRSCRAYHQPPGYGYLQRSW